MLDTGSTDLILLTDQTDGCKNKSDCSGPIFAPQKSKTYEGSDEQASGSYSDGTAWKRNFANDTFTFGDATLDSFSLSP
jgi:hypothetical protein